MKNETITYLSISGKDGENVEFDLISLREKGVEDKYFTITIGDQSASLNESNLTQLKEFFAQISWNV